MIRGDHNGRLPDIFRNKSLQLPVASCLSGHNCQSLSLNYNHAYLLFWWLTTQYNNIFIIIISACQITLCNTLRGRHQSLELWYITDIPQFAVVYQNIPQLPYTTCLALMRLRSV